MPLSTRDMLILVLMGSVILASAGDIFSDIVHGTSTRHIFVEAFLLCLSGGLMSHMLWGLRRHKHMVENLKRELNIAARAGGEKSPALQQAREQLSEAVNAQFDAWNLSPSEHEVGWLLLKGLSIREIAALRETREKTVRHQASSIYRKADLPGRHAFAAWFVEDLL